MTEVNSTNPATGETLAAYELISDRSASAIVDAVHHTFRQDWRRRSFADRSRLMRQVATLLRSREARYATLLCQEMGKPISQAVAEVRKCAWVCEYYADNAQRLLAPQAVEAERARSYLQFAPIGVVLAVMPWNFPFWQVFRFAAPTLMAGNTCVLKHAANVFGAAVALQQIFRDAGFPDDCFRSLLIDASQVAAVIEHPHIRAVTMTGSTKAGREVASAAGKALKKTVLELGGSDPYVVLDDADLELAAEKCAASRLMNSGQSCVAAKRFIVTRKHHDEFVHRLCQRMAARRLGDPSESDTDVGPQARRDLRDVLHTQVKGAISDGAEVVLGGILPDGPGAFYPPTVLVGVRRGMAVYHEETFGPVASVICAEDEAEAIDIANDTAFGLGSALFSQDIDRAERIARDEIDAGSCFINDYVSSDPRLPFGGVKDSGYGRELGELGIREFVNVKTVCVSAQDTPTGRRPR